MVKELFFDTHDNIRTIQLSNDQADGIFLVTDLSQATKITIEFEDTDLATIDSTVETEAIDFTRDPVNGVVDLKLGGLGIAPGSYAAAIVVYDDVATNGIRWEPELVITIREF
jgi:hypothetical protein